MKSLKKNYIEVCLTTEDGIQHLRCHGWLKREKYLIKSEQIFGGSSEDFGMFIVIIANDDLYEVIELKGDMFNSFEVLSKEEERWGTYKKLRDKDAIQNISNFMFSLVPETMVDIDKFIETANETTLDLFKTSDDFRGDYVLNDFMTVSEKTKDLDYLISFFEQRERYEDCALLVKIKNKIISNDEFANK